MKRFIKPAIWCLAALMAVSTGVRPAKASDVISTFVYRMPLLSTDELNSIMMLGLNNEFSEHILPIEKSITDNGITVKLNGIGFDGRIFVLKYEVFSDELIAYANASDNRTLGFNANVNLVYTDLVEEKYKYLPEIEEALDKYSKGEIIKQELHQILTKYSSNNSMNDMSIFSRSSGTLRQEGDRFVGYSTFELMEYDYFPSKVSRNPDFNLSVTMNGFSINKTVMSEDEIEEGFSKPSYYNLIAENPETKSQPIPVTKAIEGYWQFDIGLNENQIAVPTEKLTLLDNILQKDNEVIKVSEIYKSPFRNGMIIESNIDFNRRAISDSKSISYNYGPSSTNFLILDQNGKNVTQYGFSSSNNYSQSDDRQYSYKVSLGNLDNVEKLTIIPYLIRYNAMKTPFDMSYVDIPFESVNVPYEVNKTEITITNIEKSENKISVYASAKGYIAQNTLSNIFLRNESGARLSWDLSLSKWDEETNTACLEFVDINDPYLEASEYTFTKVSEAKTISVLSQDIEILEDYKLDVQIVK